MASSVNRNVGYYVVSYSGSASAVVLTLGVRFVNPCLLGHHQLLMVRMKCFLVFLGFGGFFVFVFFFWRYSVRPILETEH